MIQTRGYAASSARKALGSFTFNRRDPGAQDVAIDIQFCGVCHSDIHQVRNEWHSTTYPCVPGHEIVGTVSKVGKKVKKFKEGETVGVGCLVDSCGTCSACQEHLEQHCENGATFTYNSPDKHSQSVTYGGYSRHIVVDQNFVLKISPQLNLAAVAPLLCAGITTYSPLRRWKMGKGKKVGIVGLGGLGHMGVKLASAMGAEVVVFTTSPDKKKDAKRLGAHEVIISKNTNEMNKHDRSFDLLLNTVSSKHDMNAYLSLLKRAGTMCLVGAPEHPMPMASFNLILQRRHLSGSLIGGLKETQEMLDFCAERNIVSDIELIPIQKINEAYARILKGDVKYRFVIDIKSLK